jgi:hypothetical protein
MKSLNADLSIRAVVRSIMAEVEAVVDTWGVERPISIEQRRAQK